MHWCSSFSSANWLPHVVDCIEKNLRNFIAILFSWKVPCQHQKSKHLIAHLGQGFLHLWQLQEWKVTLRYLNIRDHSSVIYHHWFLEARIQVHLTFDREMCQFILLTIQIGAQGGWVVKGLENRMSWRSQESIISALGVADSGWSTYTM